MEISKKTFQKGDSYQLGTSFKLGLPQPYIAPWAWPLPRHGVWGQPSLDLIQISRCCTEDPALMMTFPLRGDVMTQKLCGS